MTKLKVIAWDEGHDCHECVSEDGTSIRVDLIGGLPDSVCPFSLVGKYVTVEDLDCDVFKASSVTVEEI